MRKLTRLPYLASVVVALLALGLTAAPAAQADVTGTATITLIAPRAALGQRVEVQWGDALGNWHTVQGWTGSFGYTTPQGEPFMRWTVLAGNFGQQPFRWVVYNPDAQTLWAVGPWFALPTIDGQDYAQRLDLGEGVPASAPTPIPPTPAAPSATATPPAPAGGVLALPGSTYIYGQPCFGSNCGGGQISALIGGLPSTTWIAVQWLDQFGQWQTVAGWQGTAISVDVNGVLLAQWNYGPEVLGHGPFRWALYPYQGGNLFAVSPAFNMPTTSRLNLIMSLAVH